MTRLGILWRELRPDRNPLRRARDRAEAPFWPAFSPPSSSAFRWPRSSPGGGNHEIASAADKRLSKTVRPLRRLHAAGRGFVCLRLRADRRPDHRRGHRHPAAAMAGAWLQRRRVAGHRGGPSSAGPAQRGWVPGRGGPRLEPPVPLLPHQSGANRRTRWLWGAFEQFRMALAARLPEDDCQQIDTSALPVRHPSRVRGPDGWAGPNGLVARFGRDAAHAEWFYGFRLAIKTDLGSRITRAWSIVPAAVNEREVAEDLLKTGPPPATCWQTRDSTARRSLPPRPPGAPPCSSRPPRASAPACP